MKDVKQIARLAFEFRTTDSFAIWNSLKGSLRKFEFGESWKFMSREYNADGIGATLQSRGKPHFNVESDLLKISHGPLGSFSFDKLILWSKKYLTIDEWDSFLSQLVLHAGFIQASVTDYEYSFWQNAEDPAQYKSKNRDCSGLPKVVRDAPPPLNIEIIDTSQNAGREVLRRGYFEGVGGVMWLAERFFQRSGGNRTTLRQLGFLQIEEQESVLRIIVDDRFLAEAVHDENMAKKIEEVRSVLFPRETE